MEFCKEWLCEIDRTPPPEKTRLGAWKLDKNEFLPSWHSELYAQFLERLTPEHLSTHPELGSLYTKISQYTGWPVSGILIGAGSDLCIHAAFDAFVLPGRRVVFPDPTFLMYDIYAKASGAVVTKVDYGKNFTLSADDLCRSIDKTTALLCLPNPGSPIGYTLPLTDLRHVLAHTLQLGVPTLIDEAYFPFCEQTLLPELASWPHVVVTRTFSKAAGLAGCRIGFAVGNPKLISCLRAFKPMYEISSPSILLAEIALENTARMDEYAEDIRRSRTFLDNFFTSRRYKTYQGDANFMLVDFGTDRKRIIKSLDDAGVLYKSRFDHPVLTGWSRFSIGPEAYMRKFVHYFKNLEGNDAKRTLFDG